jgi:hypothetical protein
MKKILVIVLVAILLAFAYSHYFKSKNSSTLSIPVQSQTIAGTKEVTLTEPKITIEFPSQFILKRSQYWGEENNIPNYLFSEESWSENYNIDSVAYFNDVTFFTEENLKDWVKSCTGECLEYEYPDGGPDREGALQQFYEDKKIFTSKNYNSVEAQEFNGRMWIKSPIDYDTASGSVSRNYKTFIGDTEIIVRITRSKQPLDGEGQADTVFSAFKIK